MNAPKSSPSPRHRFPRRTTRPARTHRSRSSGFSVERLEARHLLAGQDLLSLTHGTVAHPPGIATVAAPARFAAASTVTGAFGLGTICSSSDGRFQLKLRPGGDLWLTTSWAPDQPYWSTGTGGSNADTAVMQGDGNFVLYRNGAAVWFTGTFGHPGSTLRLQDDGNLVIYAPGDLSLIHI